MANDCDNSSDWHLLLPRGGLIRGDPVVGAVGEMASMKQRKLWKTGADGLCCSSRAIQTLLGLSSLLEEWSKTPIVFVVLLCCRLPPNLGETAKLYR